MNIQIIGAKKCRDTQKTERYFKERKIAYHFVDLTQRGLSKGEMEKIKAAVGLENLVNRNSRDYEKLNMKYIVHNLEEMLLAHPAATEYTDRAKRWQSHLGILPGNMEGMGLMPAFVYVLECADGTFYTGWTNNPEKRLISHNEGSGARYTRGRLPVKIVYVEELTTRQDAQRREAAIKSLTRRQKEALVGKWING